jgi:hypothetical protein
MLSILTKEKQKNIYSLKFDSTHIQFPTLDESFEHIQRLDFSMIIYKITQPDPSIAMLWDEESAIEAIRYYKNYLWLLRKYSELHSVIPPSIEIDEIWHHHILDTYQYEQDCLRIFGQFLHHYPYFGMRGEQDKIDLHNQFEITQQLHFKECGEYIFSFEAV